MNALVQYAGLAPGMFGVYEALATVPSGVAHDNAVPVALTVQSQTSPAVTMAVQ